MVGKTQNPKTLGGVVLFAPSSNSEPSKGWNPCEEQNLPKLQEFTVSALIALTVSAALCIRPLCTDHSFFLWKGFRVESGFKVSPSVFRLLPILSLTHYLFERARTSKFVTCPACCYAQRFCVTHYGYRCQGSSEGLRFIPSCY